MAREVRVAILGDSRDFSRAVSSAKSEAGKLDGIFSGIGRSAVRAGKVIAVGLGAGAVALGALAKSAIDSGSDLNEVLSKSNTVFGEHGREVEAWANTAAEAFGQSKKEALDAASSFGNMFIQLGITRPKAVKMSKAMTELASDFASFHNADISEVLVAQQAAFRGEYDAVQRFVPTINAAAVEQKALKMGLGKTTKELTAQDKALATQALLLEGAGDAMGDFARTSDGLANKQRIMSARFEDVKAKIGQKLIPIAMALVGAFDKYVLPVIDLVTAAIAIMARAFGNGGADVKDTGNTFVDVFAKIGDALGDAYRAVIDFVENALEALGGWWEDNGPTIMSAAESIGGAIADAFGVVQDAWENILKPAFDKITDWFTESPGRIQWLAAVAVISFGAWAIAAGIAAAATLAPALPLIFMAGLVAALAGATSYLIDRFDLMPKASGVFQWAIDNILDPLEDLITKLAVAVGLLEEFKSLVGLIPKALGVKEADKSIVAELFPEETKANVKQIVAGGMNGARAMGGPVSPGRWLVGEKGPEILDIGASGHVTPNDELGMQPFVVNNNFYGKVDQDSIGEMTHRLRVAQLEMAG